MAINGAIRHADGRQRQQVISTTPLVAHGGDMAISAIGIVMSIATLLFMPVLGRSSEPRKTLAITMVPGETKGGRHLKLAVMAEPVLH